MSRLNSRQEKFIRYIVQGMKQRQAYKKAYNPKYPNKTVDEKACVLFNSPKVQARYKELLDKVDKEVVVSVSQIINELKAIAFASGTDYAKVSTRLRTVNYDKDGVPIKDEYTDVDYTNTEDLSDESKKAISCIKNGKNGISVETYDKVKALELLGKFKGMWKEQSISKTVSMNYEDYIREIESNNEY